MSQSFESVVDQIRDRVEPDEAERTAMSDIVERLVADAEAELAARDVDGEVVHVGSTARGTWLAGNRDIDIFVCVSPDLDRDDLESIGLEIGHEILPESHEEYAEHPYVVGEFEDFSVDIVPCYAVEDPSEIKSAVDRTPFHNSYLGEELTPELASDVRVCKQFLTAIGAYGSNLQTRGFSGFLTELLVLEYGGFQELIEAAADWEPSVRLDPAGHGSALFEDQLVVIDPTDPVRNVAAVLSKENLTRFQHFARQLLEEPRTELFEVPELEPIGADRVRQWFADRGTTPYAIQFETPDIVDDQLWPQLDRSLDGLVTELNRRGFDVFRSTALADEAETVLLFELAVTQRPRFERHVGPPVHVRDHAESFYESYEDTTSAGPYIQQDRYIVERTRDVTTAGEFLNSDAIFEVSLGAQVESTLEDKYKVLRGATDLSKLAERFGIELAYYFDPTPYARP